jgi:hypothetical protein
MGFPLSGGCDNQQAIRVPRLGMDFVLSIGATVCSEHFLCLKMVLDMPRV